MNKVKLIVEGYAKELSGYELATANATLIQTNNENVLVDPGINKKLLMTNLAKEGLSPREIHYVFLTHHHPDHAYLAALFENVKLFDGTTIYEKDKETEYKEFLPDTDIKVILTPGHTDEHASLLVPTKDKGNICVAGDVFWWTDSEPQKTDRRNLLLKKDPYASDPASLKESRKKILKEAGWIIPGHGKMFEVD